MVLFEVIFFVFSIMMMGWFGIVFLVVYGIVINIVGFVFMMYFGLLSVVIVWVGNVLGCKDYDYFVCGVWMVIWMSLGFFVVVVMVMVFIL